MLRGAQRTDKRGRGFDSRPGTTAYNLEQVIHTYMPLSPSSIILYWPWAVMPGGWVGNPCVGLVEDLWLMSPAWWLPNIGIISGLLHLCSTYRCGTLSYLTQVLVSEWKDILKTASFWARDPFKTHGFTNVRETRKRDSQKKADSSEYNEQYPVVY